jgi:vanillate O-demethylase ferredoxin subunit
MSARPTWRVRVARKAAEAEGIVRLELRPLPGQTLPPFEAGAHVELHLPQGVVRPYSLCNRPGAVDHYELAVLRESASRGGSAAVHEQLHEGDEVEIGAPRNLFPLAREATRHLLLAGGIGITPLLAMAEQLLADGADFHLHHCTRSAARTPFAQRLAEPRFAGRATQHHDDGPAAQRADLQAWLARPEPGTHLYVCGPAGFMQAVLRTAQHLGWPAAQVHSESFGAAPAVPEAAGEAGGAFEVQLGQGGRVVPVAAGQSVVAALAAAGVAVPVSCEQGVCGTCLTRVLAGEPLHCDQYLTDEERAANDQFLPCCSRARTPRLVLDLA